MKESVVADISFPKSYFSKRARDLREQVRAGNEAACTRVRQVYFAVADMPNQELQSYLGLMRAQHVVAVEHGFRNWQELSASSSIEVRLAITMDRYPDLNDFGVGLYQGHQKKSATEKAAIKAKDRQDLRASGAAVEATATWLLENVKPTRTINHRHTSYGLKHIAEKDLGYITNGVFIAAAIIADYPCKFLPGSANVQFGMSERSLTEIETRRRSPERLLRRFTPSAQDILRRRGAEPLKVGRDGTDLVWRENGELRTLQIGVTETTPFIVRLFVDHYSLLVPKRTARALGIDSSSPYGMEANPTRPKGEISVLLDEVEQALEWALDYDVRVPDRDRPPFEVSDWNTWDYMWSRRALMRIENKGDGSGLMQQQTAEMRQGA